MDRQICSGRAYRFCVAVVFVGMVLAGQAMAQGPLRGPSGEIILGLGTLSSAAYSPDGRNIATCSRLGAFLWDVDSRQVIRGFWGHTDWVSSVVFSSDGTKLLTGSNDTTAKLWDAATGAEIRTFSGHSGPVYSVAFSPNGTKVLTGSWDTTAKLWDAATGAEIRTFPGHIDGLWSVAFSPDGTKVLTGSADNTAKLWNAASGALIQTLSGHVEAVVSVAFAPDGSRALTGSSDGTTRIWDIEPISPTPTPEPTHTPTRTPTPIATATPEPSTLDMTPWRVFTFDSAQEFQRYPGGFIGAQNGNVFLGSIPDDSDGFTDGQGVTIVTSPGQLELLVFPTLDIGENVALIRLSVHSIGAGAAVGLGALDGSNDGSIATNIPANSGIFADGYHRMVLLYDPPGESFVPVVQVANLSGIENVLIYVDNLEIFLIPEDGNVPSRLLHGQ